MSKDTSTKRELYFTPEQLSDYFYGVVPVEVLAKWRLTGKTPRFEMIGGEPRYPASAILEFGDEPEDAEWIELHEKAERDLQPARPSTLVQLRWRED